LRLESIGRLEVEVQEVCCLKEDTLIELWLRLRGRAIEACEKVGHVSSFMVHGRVMAIVSPQSKLWGTAPLRKAI